MAHGNKKYEVWGLAGCRDAFAFESDSEVEVVHWLRANRGNSIYNVHPNGPMFVRGRMIAHDFISRHALATADDIVKKAFAAGNPEGVAENLHNLFFGLD